MHQSLALMITNKTQGIPPQYSELSTVNSWYQDLATTKLNILTQNQGSNEGKQLSTLLAVTTSCYKDQIHGDRGSCYIKK